MNTIKSNIIKLLSTIYKIAFRITNYLIPKNKHQICFSTGPDYDDMARAITTEIINTPSCVYRIVFLVAGNTSKPEWANHKIVTQVKRHTLASMWIFFRSKHVFYTHGCFSNIKYINRQVVVNLWHGMPIKKIGRYIDLNHVAQEPNYALSTSTFFLILWRTHLA